MLNDGQNKMTTAYGSGELKTKTLNNTLNSPRRLGITVNILKFCTSVTDKMVHANSANPDQGAV